MQDVYAVTGKGGFTDSQPCLKILAFKDLFYIYKGDIFKLDSFKIPFLNLLSQFWFQTDLF